MAIPVIRQKGPIGRFRTCPKAPCTRDSRPPAAQLDGESKPARHGSRLHERTAPGKDHVGRRHTRRGTGEGIAAHPQRKRSAAYARLDGSRSGRVMAQMKQVEVVTADAATAPTESENLVDARRYQPRQLRAIIRQHSPEVALPGVNGDTELQSCLAHLILESQAYSGPTNGQRVSRVMSYPCSSPTGSAVPDDAPTVQCQAPFPADRPGHAHAQPGAG